MDIYSYWHSGRKNAPEIVQVCFDRWEKLNPGHRLFVLQEDELIDILQDFPFDLGLLPVQARADILRVRLMRLYGGAWIDATLLPILPLDLWYETYCSPSGLFVFSGPPAHWRLGNFLILARQGNYFIHALDDAIKEYWTHPRRIFDVYIQPTWPAGKRLTLRSLTTKGMGQAYLDFHRKWRKDLLYPVSHDGRLSKFFPYFWEHYLMMQLIERQSEARKIVQSMTYRQYDLCHGIQTSYKTLGDDFLRAIPITLRCSPVQKLDWRIKWPDEILEIPMANQVLI